MSHQLEEAPYTQAFDEATKPRTTSTTELAFKKVEGTAAREHLAEQELIFLLLDTESLEDSSLEVLHRFRLLADCEVAEWWRPKGDTLTRTAIDVLPDLLDLLNGSPPLFSSGEASVLAKEYGPAARSFATRSLIVERIEDETPTRREAAQALGLRSVAAFPVVDADGVMGVMTLLTKRSLSEDEAVFAFLPVFTRLMRTRLEKDRAGREAASLKRQLEDLKQQHQTRLAELAHELRNPLTALVSAVQLQHRATPGGTLDRQARRVVERQTQEVARIIENLSDYSRVGQGTLVLDRSNLDLGAVVRDITESWKAEFRKARHELHVSIPAELVSVHADITRIAQVVDNLLGMILRASSPQGTIEVRVQRLGSSGVLCIRCTGLLEGETWGLALVHGLVELHGGVLKVVPGTHGQALEFVVELPLLDQEVQEVAHREPSPTPVGLRILVVEDNRDAADMLREVLTLSGHHVDVAYKGANALATARNQVPDIVLCDIGLPHGMSGYDVARAFREDPRLSACRLVALTGYGREEDKKRALESGFDEHLTKPVEFGALDDLLRRIRS